MKKFKLIRSNLYAEKQNHISTLKIENDDYYVAFNYFCDYMGDLKNNELDMQNLAVVVKMKVNGDGNQKADLQAAESQGDKERIA